MCLLGLGLYILSQNGFAQSLGTGFFVSNDGLVATSNHVIDEATSIHVEFNGKEYLASKVAQDEANDLAILKIEGDFPFLEIKGSEEAKIGDEIFTVGYPNPELQGYEPKMTAGVISSMSGFKDDPTCYQISVPVQPGNSGGPLLSKEGEVLGIIKSKLGAKASLITSGALPENVNYAVKSDYLNLLIKMAKTKVGSLKRQVENTSMSPIDKALSCIVLIKAKNEKYQKEKTRVTQGGEDFSPSEYVWEKKFNEMSEFITTQKTLEKFDMDEPLETYEKIGAELLANGEITEKQARFFQDWRANTYWGALTSGTHWYPSSRNPKPFEQEWEKTKKQHADYLKNKEKYSSYIEKFTYMKMVKPKLKTKGLKLLAEEYESQFNEDNLQINKMRNDMLTTAIEAAKKGALFPEAKIVYRDSTGFAFTDPTINNDAIVDITTTKRVFLFSKLSPEIVIKDDKENLEMITISYVSGEAFLLKVPKSMRGDIQVVP